MAARSGTGRVRDSSDLTPFVGRAHERAELRKLLTSGSALVTLTGTGGSGKTRLADVLLADLVGCFPAGVHRIALESLSDPALLQQTVAGALGLREEPGRPLLAGLVERLAGEPRLLLLDNCEHLLSACADLAAALRVGCPELRLLATSREALGLPGERVWPLAPLVLPAAPRPGAAADPATVAGSEAAQLFVLRARRLLPEFAVTAENAAAIVATCRQLDGLPLALELAAARLRFLSPAQLAARLAQRFRLLTGGDASVPRQQTLRAAIDWSYSLLSEPEQALFCRLGVFAGSFTLEAVEAVMPPGALGGAYPLDVLERLVERSLVVAERSGEAVRFRMLESLRVYAAERLAEAGAAEEAAHAHLTFYLALAEAAAQELAGEQQARRLRELDAEQDNLRAALAFAAEALPEAGLRIAAALARYWELRGWLREGRAWLERLLERAPDVPPALLARALTRAAGLAHRQSDYAGARRLLDQALAVCRTRGAESELVTVLRQLTFTARLQLDYETARAAAQEALAVLGPSGPPVPRASLLNELGAIAHMYDEPAAAVRYLREGLALCRSVGEVQGTAVTLDNLARVLWDLDQEEEALALAQEALALHRQIGNELGAAGVLSTLAQFALDRDEPGRAERYRHEALALYRAAGNLHGAAMSVYNLGHIAFSRGDLATAARRFDEALGEAVAMNHALTLAWCLWGPAFLAAARGEHERAVVLLGGLEASRQTLHYNLNKRTRRDVARSLAAAEAALGPEAVARYRQAGRRLGLRNLVELALGGPLPKLTAEPAPAATLSEAPTQTDALMVRLSQREREVLRLLADGKSNKEIARDLVLSVRTVEHHVERLCNKLGVRTRLEAVRLAKENGFGPSTPVSISQERD